MFVAGFFRQINWCKHWPVSDNKFFSDDLTVLLVNPTGILHLPKAGLECNWQRSPIPRGLEDQGSRSRNYRFLDNHIHWSDWLFKSDFSIFENSNPDPQKMWKKKQIKVRTHCTSHQPPCGAPGYQVLDILTRPDSECSHTVQFLDCRLIGQFTPVLALYDPFSVDVPLNLFF